MKYALNRGFEALSRLTDEVHYVKAWKIYVCIFSQSGNTDRWLIKLTNQTKTKADSQIGSHFCLPFETASAS